MKCVIVCGTLLVCVFSGILFWPLIENSEITEQFYEVDIKAKLSESILKLVSHVSKYVTGIYSLIENSEITEYMTGIYYRLYYSEGYSGRLNVVVNLIYKFFGLWFLYTVLKVLIT